jgi:hypothetical protein
LVARSILHFARIYRQESKCSKREIELSGKALNQDVTLMTGGF